MYHYYYRYYYYYQDTDIVIIIVIIIVVVIFLAQKFHSLTLPSLLFIICIYYFARANGVILCLA